ncbi:MAG TPA: glycine--tRNA ligase subunit beta [Candidatus Cloacimonadota bacterium]|nr:glycine--tRNA ligase subunit beta [Candidatus Cloacimonadota bacterium]HPT70667.1 glycine--tRNA ligase subunit beta [Candidatus Cloacimonadota bacterium]
MEFQDVLLEIGVEELPASYIKPALDKLVTFYKQKLSELKLQFSGISEFSTPRRLAIMIRDLQVQQMDEEIEKLGPGVGIAYKPDGSLSPAGEGFAKSSGVSIDQLLVKNTPKGDYIAVVIRKKGLHAKEILSELIPQSILQIQFPKQMRWGSLETSYARAVRWVIALLGTEIIPVSVFNLGSGRITYGNRFQKLVNPIDIPEPSKYEQCLRNVFVIADREERKATIRKQLEQMFGNSNMRVIPDEKLLDIVVDLVEYPTAVSASFDTKYLNLPEKIITSTISENQKYFAVEDMNGKLQNTFIFISNGDPQYSDLIRRGNEKVIIPRLEDAQFYFHEDTKMPLESYVSKLSEVTFQAKLGTLLEKTERMKQLGEWICRELQFSEDQTQKVLRTIQLSKADLVTLMLGEKEFTKLQGYIGMKYALLQGEDEQVAQGIYEHYQPRGQNDILPQTICGAVAAIADKMDTVCGIIGVGMLPTGSNDPFALRRAANGIVQILDSFAWNLDLHAMIDQAYAILKDKLDQKNNKDFVYDYFHQRVNWLLQQDEIDYDIIASVMHISYNSIAEIKQRALDIRSFRKRDDFIRLVIGYKRVANIIGNDEAEGEVDVSLLKEPAEQKLWQEYQVLSGKVEDYLGRKEFHKMMEAFVDYGPFIDRFFDDVLVNSEDENLRKNRYILLSKIKKLFIVVCDLTKIVVEGE